LAVSDSLLQLSDVNDQLLANPSDEGNLALKEVLEEEIPKLEAEVNAMKAAGAASAVAVASDASGNLTIVPPSTADLPPLPPSPIDTAASPTVASPPPVATNTNTQPTVPLQVFQVGDVVQAKWTDGKWYAAIVLSKTGSSKNPMYFVQYKDYDERATVASKDVKPPYDWKTAKKRKAEEELTRSNNNSTVISRPSTVDPKLAAQAKKQNTSASPTTSTNHAKAPKLAPSKIYKNIDKKGLEKAQSNWQDFSKNSKWAKKNKHKESQFRVGEGAGARGKYPF
jgi:survival-of-motor-neuron-related-splicing factor 30